MALKKEKRMSNSIKKTNGEIIWINLFGNIVKKMAMSFTHRHLLLLVTP